MAMAMALAMALALVIANGGGKSRTSHHVGGTIRARQKSFHTCGRHRLLAASGLALSTRGAIPHQKGPVLNLQLQAPLHSGVLFSYEALMRSAPSLICGCSGELG